MLLKRTRQLVPDLVILGSTFLARVVHSQCVRVAERAETESESLESTFSRHEGGGEKLRERVCISLFYGALECRGISRN